MWTGPVWRLPRDANVPPGAFLFTDDAELVGGVTRYGDGLAVVPGRLLWDAAENLLRQPHKVPVDLGIDVEALTPRLSLASGADSGVVITWIDPRSIVAGQLKPGDVIQAVDDVNIPSPEHWLVRTARLGVGDAIAIRVMRAGTPRDLLIVAATPAAPPSAPVLGLTMRPLARVGTEVIRVEQGSAADAAGIEAGDVITAIGASMAPTAEQVESSFASAARGDFMIVAVMRGPARRIVALQR
jgi:S1-C subfamily serine protease